MGWTMAFNAKALLSALLLAAASVTVQADSLTVDLDSTGEHEHPSPVLPRSRPSTRLRDVRARRH